MKLFIILFVILSCGCSMVSTKIVPPQNSYNYAVVFDIDSTLTPCDWCIFSTRKYAPELVQLYADKGYKVIYLTARNVYFQFNISYFLKRNLFPEGDIQVAATMSERNNFKKFKLDVLNEYIRLGWKISAAYGDSSTDFQAYTAAGIKQETVFAIKREGEPECQAGDWGKCFANWSDQVSNLKSNEL